MEGIGLSVLQIEVTNKCNLNCPHCFYYEAGENGEDYKNFLNHEAVDKLLNDLNGLELRIFFLENYRLKLHEKLPCLTPEEIENISIYALDREASANEMSEDEYKEVGKEMDIEISRMVFEHLYDDIKEVHERLPYLTPEECQEWFDCWKRWSAFQDNKLWNILTFDYVMRGWKLEELNDQREKNMSSLFDYIVLGNQEGKIKDESE